MECILIGIQHLDYVNKQGRHIQGNKLFYTFVQNNVEGFACDSCFIGSHIALPDNIQLGEKFIIYFDRFRRVSMIQRAAG